MSMKDSYIMQEQNEAGIDVDDLLTKTRRLIIGKEIILHLRI